MIAVSRGCRSRSHTGVSRVGRDFNGLRGRCIGAGVIFAFGCSLQVDGGLTSMIGVSVVSLRSVAVHGVHRDGRYRTSAVQDDGAGLRGVVCF